VTQKYRHQWKK